ncbi:DUF2254 domain-containing protein [Geodermatophilus nigrescens]
MRARLRGALWPIPAVGVLLAVGAGIGLPALDGLLERRDSGHPLSFVFGGGPAAARDVLAAMAGSLISVTGLVFSLTVVALQLGSSQYSPRLLQTFVTDRAVQLTLASLTATFVYALTVLRTVRTEDATSGETAFVPRLSVTVAYALTLASVVALLLFLGHLARMLRVETMLRDVHDEGTATLERELAGGDGPGPGRTALPAGPGTVLPSPSSGFVVGVDEAGLVDAARRHGAVLLLVPRVGDAVVGGTPLAHAWPARRSGDTDDGTDDGVGGLAADVARAVDLGFERSPDRDVAYGLRKVVDVALRALSPGINDPTTAVHALSHASALLGDLVTRSPADRHLPDDAGLLRAVVPQWSPAALLDLVMEEPLAVASGQPAVLRRMAALLREVAFRTPGGLLDDRLRGYLSAVVEVAAESTRIPAGERQAWSTRLEQALAGVWPADLPDRRAG